jgi:hypothetical protein
MAEIENIFISEPLLPVVAIINIELGQQSI